MARLFFAIWPDEETARALAQVAVALAGLAGGKPVPREKIHLTLAFLGSVDAERDAAAREAARSIRGAGFELVLDQVGSFRAAGVGWAGSSDPPPRLMRLAARLSAALAARGFALEDRPFTPHVTLARRIARSVPRAPLPPLSWQASALTLVRSETGTGRYAIEESWALGRTRGADPGTSSR